MTPPPSTGSDRIPTANYPYKQPFRRSKLTKTRSTLLRTQLAQRDRGICFECRDNREHDFADWHAVHHSSFAAPDHPAAATPPHLIDTLDNLVTLCDEHYRHHLYPHQTAPKNLYIDPLTSQDPDERPLKGDTMLVSFQTSNVIHQQIKAQSLTEGIPISQLYRRLVNAAFRMYMTPPDIDAHPTDEPPYYAPSQTDFHVSPDELFPERRLNRESALARRFTEPPMKRRPNSFETLWRAKFDSNPAPDFSPTKRARANSAPLNYEPPAPPTTDQTNPDLEFDPLTPEQIDEAKQRQHIDEANERQADIEALAARAKALKEPPRDFTRTPPVIPYDPNATDLEF